jgi:hypothetical protein
VTADGWAVRKAAGPFDVPFSANGTAAEPSASMVRALRGLSGYGGTYVPRMDQRVWTVLAAEARRIDAAAGERGYAAVYAAEASALVLGGARRVLIVGGFTGSVPSPTTDELATLIRDGRINVALVPGPAYIQSTDPRVLLIERLCTRLGGATGFTARVQTYSCVTPAG